MAAKKSSGKTRAKKGSTSNVIPLRGEQAASGASGAATSGASGGAGAGHNSDAVSNARKEALIAAHRETYDLEKQEEALMAKHIQPLRDRRSEIKAELKSQFEITAPQFNAWHGVYYFDREAETGSDYITMQVIREQAAALPVGGTMDLVDLAEKASKMREEQAKAAAEKKKKSEKVENVEHTL